MIENKLINISGDDINDVEITTKGSCTYLYYQGKEIKRISRVIITPRNIEITQSIIKHNIAKQIEFATVRIKEILKDFKNSLGGSR